MDGFAGRLEAIGDLGRILLPDDCDHADAAVEGPGQLGRLNRAAPLKKGEQARQGPAVGIDHRMGIVGQHARDVFEQAAAGDVGQRANFPFADQRKEALHIDARRFEQDIAQQPLLVEQGGAIEFPAVAIDQLADQRKAVGMDARAGEPEDDVARLDAVARQRLGPVDRTDAEAGEVIVALGIFSRNPPPVMCASPSIRPDWMTGSTDCT